MYQFGKCCKFLIQLSLKCLRYLNDVLCTHMCRLCNNIYCTHHVSLLAHVGIRNNLNAKLPTPTNDMGENESDIYSTFQIHTPQWQGDYTLAALFALRERIA